MSNDLLFSIIPREGKIPVVTDERVKRVSKEARAKQLSEDEKETHDEERLVSEQQQYRVHEKQGKKEEDSANTEQEPEKKRSGKDSEDAVVDDVTYDSHGETEHHQDDDGGQPHIDTFTWVGPDLTQQRSNSIHFGISALVRSGLVPIFLNA